MKKILAISMILVLSFSMIGCGVDDPQEPELVVSAAASLTDAMGEIAEAIKRDENITLTLNFGSSGKLQKQIEEGAPSDVFVSAGQKQMNALEEKNLIDKNSRIDLLRNRLVLLVPQDNQDEINNIQDVIDKKVQIALAETETVPVGQYSKKALESLELWNKLDTENIVQSKDVNEVLTHVEQGNVSAGMVYSSDAVRGERVKQAQIFDENLHDPIVYPVAIIESSEKKDASKVFLEYLKTEKVKSIFEKYGFNMA